jgi:hypothetical protein
LFLFVFATFTANAHRNTVSREFRKFVCQIIVGDYVDNSERTAILELAPVL